MPSILSSLGITLPQIGQANWNLRLLHVRRLAELLAPRANGRGLLRIEVEPHFHHFKDVAHVPVLLFRHLKHLLVFSFPVIREPALDLAYLKARLRGEHRLVLGPQVRMMDVIQEPFLEDACLVRFKRLHALEAVLLNLAD